MDVSLFRWRGSGRDRPDQVPIADEVGVFLPLVASVRDRTAVEGSAVTQKLECFALSGAIPIRRYLAGTVIHGWLDRGNK